MPGIRMSIRTTSGRCSAAARRARLPVAGLGDDLDVVLQVEDHPQSLADHRLVVGDQHPDRHGAGSPDGQDGGDPEAAARRRADVEGAAVEGGPLPHADQAVARVRPPVRPRPSSVTSIRSAAGAVVEPDAGTGGAGVPAGVGERLLHDPVGGELHAQGPGPPGSPDTVDLDRQADVGGLADQVGEPAQRGLRRRRRRRRRPCAAPRAGGASRRAPAGRCPGRGAAAATAASGERASISSAASAWTTMRLSPCATTSCSSRAIRARSSAAASSASRSSSPSSAAARSSTAERRSARCRTKAPEAPGHPEVEQRIDDLERLERAPSVPPARRPTPRRRRSRRARPRSDRGSACRSSV